MRVAKIEAEYFMSFEKIVLDLTGKKGITLIEGIRSGVGVSSNGSGKSAILEIISWGLFDKTIRKLKKKTDIRNRFFDRKKTVVTITIERDNADDLVITRERGSTTNLIVSGLHGEGARMQETLEKILGFDYELFSRSVMYGGLASSFCSMSPSSRKELLSNFLGLQYFSTARANIKEKKDALESKVDDVIISIDNMSEKLSDYKERLSNYKTDKDIELRRINEESFELTEGMRSVKEDHVLLKQDLKQSKVEKEKYDESYEKEHAEYKEKLRDAKKRSKKFIDICRSVTAEFTRIDYELGQTREQLDDYENEDVPANCPTCGQKWLGNEEQNKSIELHMDGCKNKIIRLEKQYAELKKEKHLAEAKEDKMSKKVRDIKEPVRDDSSHTYDLALERFNSSKDKIDSAQYRIEKFKESLIEAENRWNKRIKKGKRLIRELKEERTDLRDSISDSQNMLDIYKYWYSAFSKDGIPYLLLDSAIPQLNESAQRFSEILTGGEYHIEFIPEESESGKTSSFNIKIDNATGGEGYESASSGEKTRIDLCTLLAIGDLNMSRMHEGFDQIFIDELFDGLDSEGVERVIRLFRKVYKDKSIFIITHDPSIKGVVDNTITVIKEGSISRIA